MLGYAVAFMIIALIAGAMGFGLVGGMASVGPQNCLFGRKLIKHTSRDAEMRDWQSAHGRRRRKEGRRVP